MIHLEAVANSIVYIFRKFVLYIVGIVENEVKPDSAKSSLKKSDKVIKNYSYACWLCKAESNFSHKPPKKTEVIIKSCRMCGVPNKVKVHAS